MKIKIKMFMVMLIVLFVIQSAVMANAEVPKWRILWIIFPKLNVSHSGVTYNFTLNSDEIKKIREMSEKTETFFETASNNAVDIEMTVMESTGTVSTLTEDTYLYVGENDFPSDVKQELVKADNEGRPYHLKVATFKLDGEHEKLKNWYGLGGGTYARIRFQGLSYSLYTESETNPHPEEAWVHELLHCFEQLFANLGTIPDLHSGAAHGYGKDTDYIWWKWYWDFIAGQVKDTSTGNLVGIKSDMWSHTPEGHVKVWNGHTYKIFDLTKTWQEAETYCENLGGHLATITTKEEQDMLNNMLNNAIVKSDGAFWYWLGGSREADSWKWVTGETWQYENFFTGASTSGTNLQMLSHRYGDNLGSWFNSTNSGINANPHGFVCEWDSVKNLAPVSITAENHLTDAVLGKTYDKTLTADSSTGITWSFVSGTLPNNVSVTSSGHISGTPDKLGNYNFTVNAKNDSGYDIKTFTLKVTASATVIKTSVLKDGVVGTAYEQKIEASGTQPSFSIVKGTLPTGLTLSQSGEIKGTPTEANTYTFTVRAENSVGHNDKEFSIKVNTNAVAPVITTSVLTDGIVGKLYERKIEASGTQSTFSIVKGSLPSTLTLSDNGEITGTPTEANTYTFTVRVSNSAGYNDKEFSLTISTSVTAPVIKTSILTDRIVGTSNEQKIKTTGSKTIFSIVSGTLPAGLTLTENGEITGTPTETGTYNFTVRVENAAGYVDQEFVINVVTEAVAPVIETDILFNGSVGTDYDDKIEVSGTQSTFSIVNGSLPSTLTLSDNGEITGTPTEANTYTFTVRAENSAGHNDKEFELIIFGAQQLDEQKIEEQTPAVTPVISEEPQSQSDTSQQSENEVNNSSGAGCNNFNATLTLLVLTIFVIVRYKNNF